MVIGTPKWDTFFIWCTIKAITGDPNLFMVGTHPKYEYIISLLPLHHLCLASFPNGVFAISMLCFLVCIETTLE